MKRRPLLKLPQQLSLFDFEFPPVSLPPTTAPPPPADPNKPAPKRRALLGEHGIEYTLKRTKRRSIGFLIEDDGLRVAAPRWTSIAEIEEAMGSKLDWITRKLEELQQRLTRQQRDAIEWRDGARIPFLGGGLALHLVVGRRATGAVFDPDRATLTLTLPADASRETIKMRTLRWLQDEARRLFAQRLAHYAALLGVSYTAFALSSATTQWGSCNTQGQIRLNWRLIHLSPELVDYVVAHELAHLREMNHSPRFWATVESIYPEHRHARDILRNYSPGAMPSS